MSWTHLLPDDTTPVTAANFTAIPAGTSSGSFAWHAWWYKGLTTGPAQSRLYFRARVAGAYSGHAILDQHAIEMRITGSDNPDSDPDFVPYTTGWTRIGANRVFECPPMRSNCALYLEVRLSPLAQHSGTTASVTWDVVPIVDEDPPWETEILHHGILTGVGDGATSEWVISPTVTETGTPDAYANVSARQWLYLGIPHVGAAEAVELDQTDGDGATLGSGESYLAFLSQDPAGGGAVTVTKGTKAASPDFPVLPDGEWWMATVTVAYGAGGSVITTADIALEPSDTRSGRFEPLAGTGLELLVNPGRTATATVTAQTSVTLPASDTRYAWVGKGGGIVLTTTATPPAAGATPICDVTTDGSGVTALTDRRVFAEPNAECWRLSVGGTLTVGAGVAALVAPWRGAIDRATARLWVASAGATGSTGIALQVAGADVGTASIAAGGKSGALVLTETAFEAGDLLTLDIHTITSGGTTEVGCDLHLWVCRR